MLLLVQLTPLPRRCSVGSPRTRSNCCGLWGPDAEPAARLGSWSRISLTPADTRAAMVLFLSYGLLFVVTVQRIGGVEDVERLLRWCGLSAVVMAGFALAQYFAGNGKFFWFYESPFTDTLRVAKGSFTNRNHFAHFLALGIGPLIWWLARHSPPRAPRSDRGISRSPAASINAASFTAIF